MYLVHVGAAGGANKSGQNPGKKQRTGKGDNRDAYPVAGGTLIISEFRLRGPGGANDEFIEIYNDSDSSITVTAPDGSTGFSLVASDGVVRFSIPNGTIIAARGHYLGVNSLGYSLGVPGDATYTNNIRDNGADEGGVYDGIALFNTSDPANFTLANRLDAVGSERVSDELYREGSGYPARTSSEIWDSLARDLSNGTPQDTDDNAADFLSVANDGLSTGTGQKLDGPSPKNLKDYIRPFAECSSLSFSRTDFAMGTNPQSVAIADFNADGKSDLASANATSSGVSILLGTGTGSFGAATNFAAGLEPLSIAVGDFNADGKSDLAIANGSSSNVSILLGTGTGSFGAATNFAVGTGPSSITISDFNADGKSDLVTANTNSNNVSVLLGTGTGGFSAPSNFAVGTFPLSVAVADFNADGKIDVAAANQNSNNVSVILGTGTGSFGAATNFAAGTGPYSVTVGDFNSDGKSDLAAANVGSNNISVLLGTGTGSFGAVANFAVAGSPRSVTVGDFNGDGKSDLATANVVSNNASVLLGMGTGNFGTAANFAVGTIPNFIGVADFNADGKSDLVTANEGSNNVSILLNSCVAQIITVSNTSNAGAGSLRQAIIDANAQAGVQNIIFNIGSGLRTINILSSLPDITDPVVIDGTTQPGYAGAPLIELNGSGSADGLTISGGNSTVRGLIINRSPFSLIRIITNGGNRIEGCYVGTNATGTVGQGAILNGISILSSNNIIGGTSAGARNVISGNGSGIVIDSIGASGNVVQGNYIGTDASGTIKIGNTFNGILVSSASGNIIGGIGSGARNVISGNGDGRDGTTGVLLVGSNNQLLGNYIGTNAAGNAPIGNLGNGVVIVGNNNVVGDATGGGGSNTIAFNTRSGLTVVGDSSNNAIRRNSSYANNLLGIDLGNDNVTPNDTGDTDSGINNLQNFPVLTGVSSGALSTTVQGTLNSIPSMTFTLDFFASAACDPFGNGEGQTFLGIASVTTDGSGNAGFAPTFNTPVPEGQFISAVATGPNGNTSEFSECRQITGTTLTVSNTIDSGAGSLRQAILDSNSTAGVQVITFNIPGSGVRTITPTSALPDITDTIVIDGYTQPGASANTLSVGDNAVLLIELNGMNAGAGAKGLNISAPNSTVRGLVINRFQSHGLLLTSGSSGSIVQGNFIGTGATGSIALGNGAVGLKSNSSANALGGRSPAARNIISGNAQAGINIDSTTNNVVQGNYIGTDITGFAAFGNGQAGVGISTASNNTVGGMSPGAGNLIAYNPVGVQIGLNAADTSTANTILANGIFNNTGLGIDLGGDGITPNDSNDADTGPNSLHNFPVLTSAISNGGTTIVMGTLHSAANTMDRIEFFASAACDASGNGEGARFLGSTVIHTDGSGNASFIQTLGTATLIGEAVTALATDHFNNTSEFSACRPTASLAVTISGRVTDVGGAGVPDVNISLSGAGSQTMRTDATGNYSFNVVAGLSYTVLPTSPYFVFTPLRSDFANIAASQTANFAVVPQATPTPTPPLQDDFNSAVRDPDKWNLGTLTQPASAFDPLVTVTQTGGQLSITPRDGAQGASFNGYVSVKSFDFTSGQISVEVPKAAGGAGAETAFALGSDALNNYRFAVMTLGSAPQSVRALIAKRLGVWVKLDEMMLVLVFQVRINGALTQQAVIPYDPVQLRYWRFRHDPPQNAVLFETSPNNSAYVERFRKTLDKSVSALAVELTAGTTTPATGTTNAIFDNLSLVSGNAQFSTDGLSASEGDGRITITVTRSVNVAGSPATLTYLTTDSDTFTIGCFDRVGNQGAAYARCDFATTVGTLSFAAGETSKSFTVPLIDDGFSEDSETFQLKLTNATGAALGAPSLIRVTITDNDAAGAQNPVVTSHPFFVRQQYLDFLSREPDTGGLNAWLNVLNGCANPNTGPNVASGCDRIFVSGEGFFRSAEFQLKGFYVFRFYKVAFNRLPEYLEVVADMSFVAGSTAEEVYARKAQLATLVTQRAEFQSAYGGLTNSQYVSALMERYGLGQVTTFDPANPDGTVKVTLTSAELTTRLNANTLTRAQVMRAIADSEAVGSQEFNNAFVGMQYYGYLRRKPDTGGFNAWLSVLQSGDVRTMVNGFLNSVEYKLRFGNP